MVTSENRGTFLQSLAVFVFLSCLVLSLGGCDTTKPTEKGADLETEKDKASYIIGTDIAKSLLKMKDDISFDALITGMQDKFKEKPLKVDGDEAKKIMSLFSEKLREKENERYALSARENLEEGNKFLADNKEKEGVVTTASGLQYVVLKKGEGPAPSATGKVTVHYRGTTIDGTEFDSSYRRNEPASFAVNGVIKGWTEALQLMNAGSKYKLFIPSELAYGERGAGQDIGPNEVLIFEVELLEIGD